MKLKTALARRPLSSGLCLLASVLCLSLSAASPNNSIITLVPPAREGPSYSPTAIALMQQADYVCAIVEVTSRKKDLSAQIDDIRQTTTLIAQAVEKTPNLSLHYGPARFSSGQYLSKFASYSIS